MAATFVHRYLMSAGLLSLVGCGSASEPSQPRTEATATSSVSALATALGECSDKLDTCAAESDADAGAPTQCVTDFETCKDDAVGKATSEIAAVARACAQDFKTCKSSGAEVRDCAHALAACVGNDDAHSDGGSASADSVDNEQVAQVHACVDTMKACIASDQEAKSCTAPLHDCIDSAVSHGGRGQDPTDGGAADGANAGHDAQKECEASFQSCVDGGETRMTCARGLRDCIEGS